MSVENRKSIRAAFFAQKPKSKIITIQGVQMELRQPSLGEFYTSNSTEVAEDQDRKSLVVKMLMDYCYVPGTSEKVFEDTDKEALMALPFNQEWQTLQKEINNLFDFDASVKEAVKNSAETP